VVGSDQDGAECLPLSGKTPLKIIALRDDLDALLESSFLRNSLFAKIDRPLSFFPIERSQSLPRLDNVIYLTLSNTLVEPILKTVRAGHRNVGVLHMGDELGDLECGWYGEVDYVLRTYWFEERMRVPPGGRCQTIEWIPNGYANGIGPRPPRTLLPASLREIGYFFSGWFSADRPSTAERYRMVEVIAENNIPAFINLTEHFGGGYKAASYGGMAENAKFCLVPKGRADETIRFFDALECGSIPISLRHPFIESAAALGNPPVVLLESWDEFPALHARIQTLRGEELDEIQRAVIAWWSSYKAGLQTMVAQIVETSFARYGVV